MPKITFIRQDGSEDVAEVPAGTTIMRAAVDNGIDGIVAECGGSCMCATCHVYVAEADLPRLPPMGTAENEMLESAASPRRQNSRLGCQIPLTAALDGLVVHTPPTQV